MSEIPIGLCQCGCGEKTSIASYNRTNRGWIKGQPLRYLTGHSGRGKPNPSVSRARQAERSGQATRCDCGTCTTCKKRLSARVLRARRSLKINSTRKEWRERNSDRVQAQAREQIKSWRSEDENKIKQRAHSTVKRALKSGVLTRESCEECGDPNVHAHHDDYSKPLEVRWLCPRHHGEQHRKVAA